MKDAKGRSMQKAQFLGLYYLDTAGPVLFQIRESEVSSLHLLISLIF